MDSTNSTHPGAFYTWIGQQRPKLLPLRRAPRNDDLNDEQAGSSQPPDAPAQTTPPLVAYGRLVKHKMTSPTRPRLYPASCTRCVEERQALLFAHVLQLLELSKKNEKAKPWIITPDVAKKISSYVKAFVFSPTTTSYRDLNCKVKGLPEEDDTVAVDLVLAKIRDKGTHYRNVYKTKVKESMEKDSAIENIAALSHNLIKSTNDDGFWPKVDETIAKFRKDSNNQDEFNLCFNTIYEDDKEVHGDPAKTDFKTVESEGVPGWQATLRKHAGNVQPIPKGAGGPPQKKRRVEQLENSSDGG
ncbi:hypothetical protein B0H11DRAFT_2234583 [Mycena galericulata]|nr:hypothetical protein B0H11DRAFT_2234583 [Mycena galericulata]